MLHEAKPTRAQRGGVVGRDAQPGAPRLPSGPDHGDVPQKKGRRSRLKSRRQEKLLARSAVLLSVGFNTTTTV